MQRVESSIRVSVTAEQAYQYWRDFQNFPRFMKSVEEVRLLEGDGGLSHWKVKGPFGIDAEFDARLTQDIPGKSIGWNSVDGNVGTSGAVTFADLGDATDVHVVIQYFDPPGGAVGEAVSRAVRDPGQMLNEDLQRFKDIAEGRVGSGLRR